LTLLLVIFGFAAIELFWRSMDYRPSVLDNRDLWASQREALAETSRPAVALIGASRIQLGFVPSVFAQMCPKYDLFQLAIDGSQPMAVLEDLARDEGFKGVVLCSFMASALLPEKWAAQGGYVQYYQSEWRLNKKLNRLIRTFLEERLVLINPQFALQRVVPDLLLHQKWPQGYLRTFRNRSRQADYSQVDLDGFAARRIEMDQQGLQQFTPPDAAKWLEQVAKVESLVQRIQNRGGRVAFVRFVTSGEYKRVERGYFPRELYWDVFADNISAVTIHHEDVPSLAHFFAAEGSHLDYREAVPFTRHLVLELCRRQVLDCQGCSNPAETGTAKVGSGGADARLSAPAGETREIPSEGRPASHSSSP